MLADLGVFIGLTYDADSNKLFFAGMEVIDLTDEYKRDAALQYFSDEGWLERSDWPKIYVTAVRDEEYRLLYFEFTKQDDTYFSENIFGDSDIELETWGSDEIMNDSYETEEIPESIAIIGGADEPTSISLADV